MKKLSRKTRSRGNRDDLRAEYDFSGGVRGKHAARYAEGTNVFRTRGDQPHHVDVGSQRNTRNNALRLGETPPGRYCIAGADPNDLVDRFLIVDT